MAHLSAFVDPGADLEIFSGHVSVLVRQDIMSVQAPIFGHIWSQREDCSVPIAKVIIRQSAEELVHYVHYIYGVLPIDFSEPLDFALLDNIYVMARAFGDDTTTSLIATEIIKHYPSTLSAWCNRPFPPADLGFGDLARMIDAVSFIRKHCFRAALPAALYDICRYFSPCQVVEGIIRRDGTSKSLMFHDQLWCLRAMEELRQLTTLYTYAWLNSEYTYAGDLCSQTSCDHYRSWQRDRTWGAAPKIYPFDAWNIECSISLCDYCASEGNMSQQRGREDVWRMLPDVLGLQKWHILEACQAEKLKQREVPVYDYWSIALSTRTSLRLQGPS